MNYFEKIEAYKNGSLSEVERLVFEETLAENPALQQEVAGYELGQDLFGFAGSTLSEEAITAPETTHIADLLINFTANHLSEEQILATDSAVKNTAIIRSLNRTSNRIAWLVAASMLLILSLIGSQFYTGQQQNIDQTVVEHQVIKPVIIAPASPVSLPEDTAPQQEIVAKETPRSKVERKAKKVRKNRTNNVQHLAQNTPQKKAAPLSTRPEMPILEPLVANITAQEITTGKIFDARESVVYNGENSVTLKAGFHAKAGASFVATAASSANLSANEVIESNQSVVYKASKTITLKPGFHAKSGTDFTAKVNTGTVEQLSINVVISSNEAVIYKAGNTITLKPGFHAKVGSDFRAEIGK